MQIRVKTQSEIIEQTKQLFNALASGNVVTAPPYGWRYMKDGSIYCEDAEYLISSDRIHESEWLSHMLEKKWFDANKFLPVYFYALRKKGITEQKVKTYALGEHLISINR